MEASVFHFRQGATVGGNEWPHNLRITMKGKLLPIQNRILYRLAQGYSPPDIAEQLRLPLKAIQTHLSAMYQKGSICQHPDTR